jgi:hypothetical protein
MSPTEIAVDDVRQTIAEAPTAARGLDKVLTLSGCWVPTELVEAMADGLAQYGTSIHISRTLESLALWRHDKYRPVIQRSLRERMLREIDRADSALTAQPVETLHVMPDDFPPAGVDILSLPSNETPLTAEQIAELPEETWIEIRLTAPIRALAAAQ